ncbi:MAG: SOS response-associated peptidase [Planctomycetales bacterium]|nr:SOS response-associated peptidase [Planctomycetales bacterium]
MCGRFTLHARLNLLLQQFSLEAGADIAPQIVPRYNIAPTQNAAIVRWDVDRERRELALLRWGLVPSWAKELAIGNRMINARSETIAEKPSFRTAFKRRRCLVLADGYYEWQKTADGKQPFYIHRADERPFAMAGLWESWHTGQPDGVETFTIITTDACAQTAAIHDRMPVILDEPNYDLWLDPEFSGTAELQALLRPYRDDEIAADPVSTYVNSPRHEGPDCIAPVH